MWVEIFLFAFIVWAIWTHTKKPANYPPGIWGLPVIGYIPTSMKNFDEKLAKYREKYGNIYCWKLGSLVLVFLYDFKTFKEAYQTNAFVNRPPIRATLQLIDDEERLGVIGTNGAHWQNIRRFMLRHLRDLGMGKSKLVSAIHHEAFELVKVMKEQAGTPAPIPEALTPAIINVLWQMVASQRYELNSKKILEFYSMIRRLQNSGAGMFLLEIFPWIEKIVPSFILTRVLDKSVFTDLSNHFKQCFKEDIDNHIETLDENYPRDLIDDYLIEMKKQKGDPESTMSHKDLVACLADLFAAGLETTTHTIMFSILYLAKNPEVQKKLHSEIDDALPNHTLVTLEDKARMPYTEAFINEVLRCSSLVAFGVMHSVTNDTMLEGYIIPKDAIIFTAMGYNHLDSRYFDSPNEFRPERFLNSEGKVELPKEGFSPFGTGKRQCLGESLARMELLIFLTTLMQHLEFSAPPGKEIDVRPQDLPLFHMPRADQDILITVRN